MAQVVPSCRASSDGVMKKTDDLSVGGKTNDNAGAGSCHYTGGNGDFQLLQTNSANKFPLLKRQTLIFLG